MEREPKAERKGRSAAEVCTSEARKIGEALVSARGAEPMSVLRTSVTKQTGDMVYSEAGWRRFLSLGAGMTMLYALERESNLGSTFAVFVELSERRDVGSGPVPHVRDLASHSVPLDQSLQRNRTRRTRGSQQPPAQLLARDARANREHHPRAPSQAPVLGRAQAQGKAGDAAARRGVACGQYFWQHLESCRIDKSAEEAETHNAMLRAVLPGHWSESALVHGFQRAMTARRMR